MGRSYRTRKVADRIKEVVAQACEGKIKDPRLGFLTITDVRVTGDLQHASIFYTVFGDERARADTAAALDSAKGVLRTTLGREIGLRIVPTIEFFADALPESAAQLESVIAAAHRKDEKLQLMRSVAEFAGEADPYRKPHVKELPTDEDEQTRQL